MYIEVTTFNTIQVKLLVDNCDISSPFITEFLNNSISNSTFPCPLKLADVIHVHKKDEGANKSKYRPSIDFCNIQNV